MPATALDSAIFRDIFSTEAMRQVFSDGTRTRFYLEIEAALAESGLPSPLPRLTEFAEHGIASEDVMARYRALFEQFRESGWWPSTHDAEEFLSGRAAMPAPPGAAPENAGRGLS